jgi:two-component system, sensor histidine kinase LadS
VKYGFLIAVIAYVFIGTAFSQIVLNERTMNRSVAQLAFLAEDASRSITIDDILSGEELEFRSLQKEIEIIDFTSSRWFIQFTVKNPGPKESIFLETARPITDLVDLYEINNGKVVGAWRSGDSRQFNQKTFEHRKNIFPIEFAEGDERTFFLVLESDGEMISLPLIFWQQEVFLSQDYSNQLFHGFYFGMLAVVIFIFFIFYLLLREISFLYYVIYVFFQFMLQFSLEGFTFQYLLPNQLYWSNNSVLISAAGAVFFVLLYAKAFLKLGTRLPGWNRLIHGILWLIAGILGMSLSFGKLHELSYPIINIVSLFGTVSIIYIIIALKRKGYAVNNAFALGFILLIVGAVIFILGNLGILGDAQLSEMALKISSGLEVLALSVSMAGKYRELQQEKELAQEKALEKLEQLVEERTEEVRLQKDKIQEQNKDIVDSIRYAQRIQDAILPEASTLKKVAGEHFIFYQPRDIVSGDFYFATQIINDNGSKLDFIAAVDCTGHGVPGAFMSFIGNNLLIDAIEKNKHTSPSAILGEMNQGLIKVLKMQGNSGTNIRDGMDMALIVIDRVQRIIRFSGAKNGIYLVTQRQNIEANQALHNLKIVESSSCTSILMDIKGDKKPIGYSSSMLDEQYEEIEFDYMPGDRVFLYSDGYADQFGESSHGKIKKFGSKQLKSVILSTTELNITNQGTALINYFNDWKGDLAPLDDVIILGIALK